MFSKWRTSPSGRGNSRVKTATRGAFRKISGSLLISMMSACLVIAQKGSTFGRSYQKTGAWRRSHAHSGCG
jgi:hypothetical protein